MGYKALSLIKLVLLFLALCLASFLAFGDSFHEVIPPQNIVFVLDVNPTMNTQDILSGSVSLSRLTAAKSFIQKILLTEPGSSYGLLLFNAHADYILPPTFDTGTFLLYLSGITTNLLPDGNKTFASLSGFLENEVNTSYVVLSDFDLATPARISFAEKTRLFGFGSLAGGQIRQSNGSLLYFDGASRLSSRNDQFARTFSLSYFPIDTIALAHSFQLTQQQTLLPLSQRIIFYGILGLLVVLVAFL